jgi:TonB family protein
VSAVADDLVGPRRAEFRRLLAISFALHLGAVLLLALAPHRFRSAALPPRVIAVDVVMEAPAPAPAPKAQPAPPPPAPIAVKKKVVLPKEPTLPKPKPEAKPKPKPKPQPKQELAPSDLEQPEPAADYEDVLAQLRAEAGEPDPAPSAPPQPVQTAAAQPSPGAAGGGRLSPEVAAWMRKAKLHVRRAWVVPPGFRTQPLETRLRVRLDAKGAVLGEPEVVRRSGNPWYDEGVVRAIRKASPLPPPPEAGEWEFVFVPEDSF